MKRQTKVKLLVLIGALSMSIATGLGISFAAFKTVRRLNRATSVKRIIYLSTGGDNDWEDPNNPAKFAIYAWNSNDANVAGEFLNQGAFMDPVPNSSYLYYMAIPSTDYTHIILTRHNASAKSAAWDSSVWNQTENLELMSNYNKFQIYNTTNGRSAGSDGAGGYYVLGKGSPGKGEWYGGLWTNVSTYTYTSPS